MTAYRDVVADRVMLDVLLRRLAAEKGCSYIEAIAALDRAHGEALTDATPTTLSTDAVLRAAGSRLRETDIARESDAIALAASAAAKTPKPTGRRDEHGRVLADPDAAAKWLTSDQAATRVYLEARGAGLPVADRESFVRDLRLFATEGIDYVATLQDEQHDREVRAQRFALAAAGGAPTTPAGSYHDRALRRTEAALVALEAATADPPAAADAIEERRGVFLAPVALDAPAGGDEPVRSRTPIAMIGVFEDRRYGRFSVTPATVASWQKNLKRLPGQRAPIDIDHAPEKGGSSEAAAWIVGLSIEGNLVVGDLIWTRLGIEKVTSGQYQFLSPTFASDHVDLQGRHWGPVLLAASLTNRPALTDLPPISLGRDTTPA